MKYMDCFLKKMSCYSEPFQGTICYIRENNKIQYKPNKTITDT